MRELLARIDSRELSEWMAFYSIEPFGEERADLRNALLCQTILLPHLKANTKPPSLESFMLFGDKEPEVMDGADLKQIFMKAFGNK